MLGGAAMPRTDGEGDVGDEETGIEGTSARGLLSFPTDHCPGVEADWQMFRHGFEGYMVYAYPGVCHSILRAPNHNRKRKT